MYRSNHVSTQSFALLQKDVLGFLCCYPGRRANEYSWMKNAAAFHKPSFQIQAELSLSLWLGHISLN